jgi:ferredoxin
MDYITSFCNYECNICGDVCPTGAILPTPLEEKKLIQLGKAKFVKENCIVETQKTDCGACSEHCPTKAVKMIPFEGKLTIPEVTEDICVGCGACEYACPTDPKSIYIEGNVVHEPAKEPPREELDQDIDYKEEFPF